MINVLHVNKMSDNNKISLRAFGYAMKNCPEDRQTSLTAAVEAHGKHAVLQRLEWLESVQGPTSKYINVICEDIAFMRLVFLTRPTKPNNPSSRSWFLSTCRAALSINKTILECIRYAAIM